MTRMRLFRTWTRDELVVAIRGLEEGLTTGAQSVGYSAAGTVVYVRRADAISVLRDLYERLDECDGAQPRPRVRHVRPIPLRGY